ncbi:hypothetical protein RUND412_002107 [Rhizina undulata]
MAKSKETVASKINDYTVLAISLPATSTVSEATHYVYLRRHEPKVPTADDSRCLFAVNVPIDATESHFRALFSGIGGGRVEKVLFEGEEKEKEVSTTTTTGEDGTGASKKRKRDEAADMKVEPLPSVWDREIRKSGSTAVVVFVDKSSCEMSLKAAGKKRKSPVVWGEGIGQGNIIPSMGTARYLTHHNLSYPSKALLQQSVDSYMSHFAFLETEKQRALARRRQEPDEDGFITVTRGGRVAPARPEEAAAAAAAAAKKKEKNKHQGFYRFQIREQRKERQQQLLAKFESDKKKVAERKSQRKFKPL